MRHSVAGRKLSMSTSHRRATLRGLVTDLLKHDKITTTEARAKEARKLAEHMITLGKGAGLHQRRRALAYIYDEKVVDRLFGELAPRYAERKGGYTRISKIGMRPGDGAPMVQLELVQ
jgi:large subunit ribosomal protein L17